LCLLQRMYRRKDQLYFQWGFSQRIWRDVLRKCDVENPKIIWDEVVEWGVEDEKGKTLRVILCILAFGTVVYRIWKHRNDIRHDNVLKLVEKILKIIYWEIRTQIMEIGKFRKFDMKADGGCKIESFVNDLHSLIQQRYC
jgi:hypothetical protein